MRVLSLLVPGDPATRTGGFIYDRRIARGLRALRWEVRVHRLRDGFPHPDADALAHADATLSAIPHDALVLCDGLALGAMPDVARAAARRLRLAALIHHPLALETGLDPVRAAALALSERRALEAARLVITTSDTTAGVLRERYGVPAGRLAVVEPGTDPASPARGSRTGAVALLCVGTLTPRKGHEVLIDALARVRRGSWRLTCAGSLERAPHTVRAVRARIAAASLGSRVRLLGEIDAARLARCYDEADAFVLPTRLEGYGMALAEAVAHGLPVVTTAGGAAARTVGAEAALLVPEGDVDALAAALERIVGDAQLRASLAAGARARARELPSWDDAARRMSNALETLRQA